MSQETILQHTNQISQHEQDIRNLHARHDRIGRQVAQIQVAIWFLVAMNGIVGVALIMNFFANGGN